MMLITTLVVLFLVCCRLEIRCSWAAGCSPDTTIAQPHLTSNLQQTKNKTTNVVINISREAPDEGHTRSSAQNMLSL